jgi:hypothetical protein
MTCSIQEYREQQRRDYTAIRVACWHFNTIRKERKWKTTHLDHGSFLQQPHHDPQTRQNYGEFDESNPCACSSFSPRGLRPVILLIDVLDLHLYDGLV